MQGSQISHRTPVVGDHASGAMGSTEYQPGRNFGNGRERVRAFASRHEPEPDSVNVLAETELDRKSEEFCKAFGAPRRSDGAVDAADSLIVASAFSPCAAGTQTELEDTSRSDGPTASHVDNLSGVFGPEIARNTVTNYRVQWSNFVAWANGKGVQALPANPAQVAAYLAERIEKHEHRPATLRVAASAIAFVHRNSGLEDPCASLEVKKTLRCASRKAGRHQKQAKALTAEVLAHVESTACEPRLGRGGKFESKETARRRGNLDIALISVMRDAMLRVSEAAVLTWKDITAEADGTGRLMIRCSKTDADGLETGLKSPGWGEVFRQ